MEPRVSLKLGGDRRVDRVGKRILRAVAELQLQDERMTPEQLAQRAECSLATFYRKLQREDFRELFLATIRHSLTPHTPAILSTFVKQALAGSFQHGRLVLEITGIYQEEKKVVGDITLREGESPFKDDAQRARFARATLDKLADPSPGEAAPHG